MLYSLFFNELFSLLLQQGMGMQQRPQQPNEEQAGALNLLVNLSKILKASG